MDPDRKILRANIEIKLTEDGNRWYVAACSANIENKDFSTTPLGEFFPNKDAGITEMKRRVLAWFEEKGRTETEEKVEWRVP